MLNPYELQVFLAAAEAENFSEAARKLHLTQPAVSQQIQTLEKRLQLELFERDGRRITLTEAGHALVPMARELVNLSAQIEETMAARPGDRASGHRLHEHAGQVRFALAGRLILPGIPQCPSRGGGRQALRRSAKTRTARRQPGDHERPDRTP